MRPCWYGASYIDLLSSLALAGLGERLGALFFAGFGCLSEYGERRIWATLAAILCSEMVGGVWVNIVGMVALCARMVETS